MQIDSAARHAMLFAFVFMVVFSCKQSRYPDALTPEESISHFKIDDRFKIEIFAAEPDVMDPVCMEFDEDGNVYVVEMSDYPFPPDSGMEKGRIRVLRDTNGDGRIDQSIVFADKLSEATSIFPWKGGMIVTAAPDILYLKDTNGDFRADTREVLFSGFFKNNPESQITSLKLSVDNWIYANNRGQDGNITFRNNPNAPAISVRGADFRFRLDRDLFEPETGPGQFGQTINDYGHRFFSENTLHINQSIISWRYTHRHQYMPDTKAVENISDHELDMFQLTNAPYWRAERTRRRNEEFQKNKQNLIEYESGKFTGASGGTIFGGDGFPAEFRENVFTGDVAGNIVHRDVLVLADDKTAYIAKRAETEKKKEFLASTDSWFRPTNFTVGPDGYLYVLDYYRQHIETPFAIPDDLKAGMDFMAGSDRGRIYRILPKDSTFKIIRPGLRNIESVKLVTLLAHPNQWWRQQAQRLLLERRDKSIIAAVKNLFKETDNPVAQLHALYILDALDGLDAELVKQALKDTSPGVRENALMLAEKFAACRPLILEATKDTVARVALQATLSSGTFNTKEVADVLCRVIERHGHDKWFRKAVLSSEVALSTDFLNMLSARNFFQSYEAWKGLFLEELSAVTGAGNNKPQINGLLNLLDKPAIVYADEWNRSIVKGLIKGLKFSKSPAINPGFKKSLDSLKTESRDDMEKSKQVIKIFIQSS